VSDAARGPTPPGARGRDATPSGEGVERRIAVDAEARQQRVRPAEGSRYGRGTGYRHVTPLPDPDASGPPRKGRVQSLLGALPVLMLVSGLYIYFSGENAQSGGAPIRLESVEAEGRFKGLSVAGSSAEGRHYLWFDDGSRTRGVRVPPVARVTLEALVPGEALDLRLAPTVSGSRTLWAWRVERDGELLFDDGDRLR